MGYTFNPFTGNIDNEGANDTLSNLRSPTKVNQDLIFDTGTGVNIATKDATATQDININTGNGSGGGTGNLQLGTGVDSSTGNVGTIVISTGNTSAPGTAGDIFIETGSNGTNYGSVQVLGKNITLDGQSNGGALNIQHFSSLSLNNQTLQGVNTPTNSTDAANKLYVDNLAHGLNWKQTVRTATTTTLPSYTYSAGTITATANGALPVIDGVTLVATDRLLVKNETAGNAPYNGLYTVTATGSGITPFVLTRTTDSDTNTSLQWATVQVSADASTQAGYIFRESNDIATLGSSNVAFVIISHGLDWNFTTGLSVSGNTVSLGLTVGALDGQTKNANGQVVTGGSIYAQTADSSNPGLVSTGTQSFAGNKTFTGTIGASNLSGTNTGDVTLTAVGSTPSGNGASLSGQALTLQPADGTNPGVVTAGTQTIGGAKTFSGDTTIGGNFILNTTTNSSLSGANARIPAHTSSAITFTNASLTSIASANNGGVVSGHVICIFNETGNTITIVNNYGSAAAGEAIFTGSTADVSLPNHSAMWIQYDGAGSCWTAVAQGLTNLASTAVTGVLPIARGGTNSGTALNNGRDMVSSGGAIVEGNCAPWTVTSRSASATVADGEVTLMDCSAAVRTVTLPVLRANARVTVKDSTGSSETHNITIQPNTTGSIDGVSNYVMASNYESVTLVSDGSNWFKI